MRVVTGGAGFIGSALANQLISMNEPVVVVDNFDSTLYSASLKRRRALALEARGARVIEGNDLTCLDENEPITTIFNLGATAGLTPSWNLIDTYTENNVSSLGRSLRWLVDFQPGAKVIHASTSSVYGKTATSEDLQNFLPASPYGVTKLAAEHLLGAFASEFKIRYSTLRLFSVYGPNQRPDQLFSIALRRLLEGSKINIYGDGTNARANLYVQDAVQAFIAAEARFIDKSVFDVSGTESVTAFEVVHRLADLVGVKPSLEFLPERAGDQISTIGNLEPARISLGWTPQTKFLEGTETLVKDFLAHPESYK